MKKYLLAMLSLVFLSTAWAQERTITGKITDAESGETIPGANIVEKGTSNGTITDFDGNYRLAVGDDATLVISFVGYKTTEVPVGARSVVDVELGLDVQALSEVVVVGYGTQEKKEITSAVASVGEEEFNNGNVTSAGQLLQGKVAGLSITKAGGDPNAGNTIRLRGLSTFGANSEPLIVLDGVVGASLDNVDPNDIKSIDVLKDGSAAAIYGARGSSGVILVTTKTGKGQGQATRVSFNGFTTVDQAANTIDVLSAEEYVARGGTDFGSQTDWFDELTKTAVSYTGNLSVSGNLSPNTNYRASINYRDNEGVVEGVNFDRLNTRLTVSHEALDSRLRFRFNGAVNNRKQESINLGAFRYGVIYNPTAPIFEADREGATAEEIAAAEQYGGYFQRPLFDFYNPVALANQQRYYNERKNFLTNYQVEFDILDNLTLAGNYSQDVQIGHSGWYQNSEDLVIGFGSGGIARRETYDNFNQLAEGTLRYNEQFGDLNFSGLAGVASQIKENEYFAAQVRNFLFDGTGFDNLGFGGVRVGNQTTVESNRERDVLNSVFGRVNMTYDNTYFFSASVRAESYSGFGENEKTGYFPAASAGVEITNLVDLGPVQSLKLRGSFGITGNLPPDPYLAIAGFAPGNRIDLDKDPSTPGDVFVAPSQTRNPNPTLKWETKQEINVGIDFAIFDRVTGTIDAYRRDISDLLFNVGVPVGSPNSFDGGATTNTVGNTWANIADLTQGGIEFAASYNGVALGPVQWTPSVNFTYYDKTQIQNFEVEGLGFSEIRLSTPGSPGQNNNEIIRNRVGETLGNMYGPEFAGVNELGQYLFRQPDGTVSTDAGDPNDWGVIGNGLPQGEFGITNTFVYGNFDVNFFFRGVFGHDLYNSYRGFYENQDPASNTWNSVVTDKTLEITSPPTFSDLYIENASFIRLDNAQIGYNVPVKNDKINKLRFYLAGQNLLTITNFTGIDPVVRYTDAELDNAFQAALAPGLERRNTYFTTRSITLGVNITFE